MGRSRPAKDFSPLLARLQDGDVSALEGTSIEHGGATILGEGLRTRHDLYEALLLGVHRRTAGYDWNLGFLLPHLDLTRIAALLVTHRNALDASEGIAWGLGEGGSDDPRIIDFLFHVCEACKHEDAWWCAADALEKLGQADATDLRKRTLRGWSSIDECAASLDKRAAVIGLLRQVKANNRDSIIEICVGKIESLLTGEGRPTRQSERAARNAVWLLERLRCRNQSALESLRRLYERSEDVSTSLRPRIVEAFGQIADPLTRPILEEALLSAGYYRTRAYAATGLGRIGDKRSLPVLRRALAEESDAAVIGSITEATYAVTDDSKRLLARQERVEEWPENGLIADETNYWYANPEVYQRFSDCEDPLGISLEYALTLIPEGEGLNIVDLATGTGRFALHIARHFARVREVIAVDASPQMHDYLRRRLGLETEDVRRIVRPLRASISDLTEVPDASVDAVVSSWGFPSKMWSIETCVAELREVHRIMAPGAVFITVGWDERFRDQLSELWYKFIPEPEFRRETFEEWRKRRVGRIDSPRNCHLTWIKRGLAVPLLFEDTEEAAHVLGHLFGYDAGRWVSKQQRREFAIGVGLTRDTRDSVAEALSRMSSDHRAE